MTVLDALLEGFNAGEVRGWHGRWVRGHGGKPGRVEGTYNGVKLERGVAYQGRLATGEVHTGTWTGKLTGRGVDDPQAHPEFRHVDTGAVRTFQGGEFFGKLSDVKPAGPRSLPTSRRATLGKAEGDAAARTRAEILAKSPGAAADLARHQSIAAGARAATSDPHGGFKIGDVVRHETGSRADGGHGPVTFTQQPGLSTVVGLQRNGNLRIKNPDNGTTHDVHHSHAQKVSPLHPDYRGKVVQDAYAAQRAQIEAEKAARGPRKGVADLLLGPEGRAARDRGASSATTEHADTRDKLTSLPMGQRYGLHGPQGQIGHVERMAAGWEVHGPSDVSTHKTPSSAAGMAMRLQRQAASSQRSADVMRRNYAAKGEVERMNARQQRRSEEEAIRALEIQVRTASSSRERAIAQAELDRRRKVARPAVRESEASVVLGALLERDFSAGRREKLAKSGAAMKDGSFPIESAGDLSNAIKLAGKAKDPAAAKAHIRKRAKALGLEGRLPDGF